MVVTSDRAPRHQEIEAALRRMIAEARPGDRVPSDSALAARFGVSRMTARQATERLAAEGALYRIPGAGTFVARVPIRRPVSELLSFSEEMRRRGVKPRSRLLVATVRRSSDDEALGLHVRLGDRVVHVRRVRLAGDLPIAVQDAVLPLSCAAVLDGDLEAGSLHDALRTIGTIPTSAVGGLGAAAADVEQARLLELAPNWPLLVEHLTVFDQDGRPIEFAETSYAGGRYVFDIELARRGVRSARG